MVLVIGGLLLASMLVSAILTGFMNFAAGALPGRWILLHLADFAGTVIITTFLFAAIYRFLPDVQISWRDVWVGAVMTAVLFAIGKVGIGIYLGRSSVASSYGLAGSAIVLLLWIYYSSLILLFGAELTQCYAASCGSYTGIRKGTPAFLQKLKGGASRFHLTGMSFAAPAGSRRGSDMKQGKEHDRDRLHIESEAEYLANEAALARAAIQATIRELTQSVGHAANPALWTRRYPWAAVGIAAAAGVAAGNFLPAPTRRTRRDMKRAWRRRRLESSRAERAREALLAELEKARGGERSTLAKLTGPFQRAIVRMIKTTLKSSIIAALSAGTATAAAKGTVEEERVS
jgi:hypothetical protein